MRFLFPSFLFALFAIAIPIIIHLFNFRKFKKIYFPNVRFLKEVKLETQSRSRLKHLLVLMCRILAIAFLVLAFAQPYIPASEKEIIKGEQSISIYIDNSFSMAALGRNGTLLDEAKKKAAEIANAYKPTDKFQVLTNNFEGRHQRLMPRDQFLEQLTEIKESPFVKTVPEILSRQLDILTTSGASQNTAYIISDFQRSMLEINKIKNDTTVNVSLVPLNAQKPANLFIDSVWFNTPVRQLNQPEELFARIKNSSDKSYENIPIKLFINDLQKTPASFNIDANDTTVVRLAYTLTEPGIKRGRISIEDHPVTFDDDFFFSYNIAATIPVLAINRDKESSNLNSLFNSDAYFKLSNSNEKNIDYSGFSQYRLIILNEIKNISSGLSQELKRFTEKGGHVFLFPSAEADINSYNSFLSGVNSGSINALDTSDNKVGRINNEHEIFNDVFEKTPENIDLPSVNSYYPLNSAGRSGSDWLMRLQNGKPFISVSNYGKGRIYVCAVPLNNAFSNFSKHALFVPVMYKIALSSVRSGKLFYTIGKDEPIEIAGNELKGDKILHIISSDKKTDLIPEYYVSEGISYIKAHQQLTVSGVYDLDLEGNALNALAFNYNRKESDLSVYDEKELAQAIEEAGLDNFKLIASKNKNLTQVLSEANYGKKLWKYCIIAALLFLAAEVLLIKFWKK